MPGRTGTNGVKQETQRPSMLPASTLQGAGDRPPDHRASSRPQGADYDPFVRSGAREFFLTLAS